ncbi:MAG: PLP-dependent aminotransferase family protein [Methylotenera sp.]|jgi:GntR family transcriptional regulator/MocR family aminotransferase|nr:PLP-dependent aminotransferase family protein [Methylotenera sp.]PKO50855.1 MAG: PLP-dependent aminotransferase family protein [Betaproteobacteria bacterium HGW-Betaproteobacteria-20]
MLRPWELNVDIVRQSGTAIHVQIAQKIIEDIQSGRFTPGLALPGTRDLANKINVNRKTVIQAYDELIAQGWLTSENKRGTFVSRRKLAINHDHKRQTLTPLLTSYASHKEVTPILSKRQMHDFINFNEGLPDVRLIPFEMLSRAMRHALIISVRNSKSTYGDPKGAMILREAILQMLNMERGLHAKIDNICIVRGSQMGIFLTARVFIQPGDYVAVEQLTNPLAREAFSSCGANILSVAHDNEGLDVNHLAQLCSQHKVRAIYVTPNHQMPTTVTMSYNRRLQLLALAAQYDFLIIEDDSDHEFNFTDKNTLPLASMQKSKQVIYIGSISKVLATGLRVGYIVAPAQVIDKCARQIALIDRQGDQITELAVAELLHIGEIKKHILRTLKIYGERRAFISALLHQELSGFVHFKQPDNGLAIWLEIHSAIDMITLIKDAEFGKISFTAGSSFSTDHHQIQAIRLGYANLNHDEIYLGINRLKAAFLNQQRKLLRA